MYKIIGSRKIKNRQPVRQKKTLNWSCWLYRMVFLLFFGTSVFVLFFSTQLEIINLNISGLSRLKDGLIRGEVQSILSEKYFKVISKNNLLIFPEKELMVNLKNASKYIESVQIKKKFPNTLEIDIRERKLSMLFCLPSVCYTLNAEGISYPAVNFTPNELEQEHLLRLNDLSAFQVSDGDKPLDDDFRDFVLALDGAVRDDTGIILKRTYETANHMSGDVKVETEDDFSIYFNQSVGLEKSIATLRAILEHKIEKEQQKNLAYIDLRINNKAFYKFKDGLQNITIDLPSKSESVEKNNK